MTLRMKIKALRNAAMKLNDRRAAEQCDAIEKAIAEVRAAIPGAPSARRKASGGRNRMETGGIDRSE